MANKKTSEEDLLVESGYSADGSEEFFRLSKHNGSGGYVNKKTAFLNLANWIKSFFGAAALSNDYNDLDNLPETTAGDNGVHGANALTWGNSGVVVGVPDPTKFIPNSNTATAINSIKIHEQESNEVNVSPWIAALPVGAQLKITEENNHAIFGVYVVDSKTDNGSYWTIGLTNVTGNGVFAGVCVFSYNLTGGTTGAAELVYGDLVQDATDLWKFASTVPGETAYRSDCIYRLSTGGGPVFQSGTNVTVNVNGLGAVDLLTWDGGNITPGTIKSNKHYYAQYVNGALRAVWKGTFGEATITWGNVVGGISNQTDLQTALDDKVTKNAAITGATKTKITYDAKGLVTAGADATTADIAESTDKRYVSDAQEAKIDFLTVTQPVDLDDIETRVNNLDAAVVLKGIWDASAGTFPGGGTAQAGASYIVSVGGTVDGVTFNANDRLIAIADNASATTFASNWFKADYTDQVLSVNGATGAVTITPAGIGAATASHTHTASQVTDFNAAALAAAPAETATTTGTLINTATDKATPVDADYVGLMDSAASNILKKLSWANIKATLKAYFDTL
ncbi:MAG TPA: hypothetical protein VEY71_00920, partial [Chitinophagales bacterium]|nr:hypothetical protein [Chitinophagales bacterium]